MTTADNVESVGDNSTSEEEQDSGQTSDDDGAGSEISTSSSDTDESEPVPDKKASVRKPSKKVLETAMNEVRIIRSPAICRGKLKDAPNQRPFFPTNEVAPSNVSKGPRTKATTTVNVKKEAANDLDIDEDEGEDEDAEDGPHDGGDARRIYKKALKILKLKMYFENFFPTDAEKDALPFTCWMAAVESIGQVNGGPAAARNMFYTSKYGDTVRASAGHSKFHDT